MHCFLTNVSPPKKDAEGERRQHSPFYVDCDTTAYLSPTLKENFTLAFNLEVKSFPIMTFDQIYGLLIATYFLSAANLFRVRSSLALPPLLLQARSFTPSDV